MLILMGLEVCDFLATAYQPKLAVTAIHGQT